MYNLRKIIYYKIISDIISPNTAKSIIQEKRGDSKKRFSEYFTLVFIRNKV